jgi:hypothetical protein
MADAAKSQNPTLITKNNTLKVFTSQFNSTSLLEPNDIPARTSKGRATKSPTMNVRL